MVVVGVLKVLAWALGTALTGSGLFALLHYISERANSEPSSYSNAANSPISPTTPQMSAQPAGARLAKTSERVRH